mmetsp:Transcript_42185/g.98966  ORF Transcript_42185/g.98966 Transcript_42185/m.98966 type:complete len:832 (+) Transcript_42185:82-2577(+)
MEELLGQKLLAEGGDKEVDVSALKATSIGLYFSGHWCGPCRDYTPRLAKVYQRAKELGKSLDIVFISSDHAQGEFDSYFRSMPWHALPWSDRDRFKALMEKFGVRGFPSLVIVDRDGKVVKPNARGESLEPHFVPSLPLAMHVEDPPSPLTGEVKINVRHFGKEYDMVCEPDEGWDMLQLQIFSLTEVAVEQQRLFGLGVEKGCLNAIRGQVSLGQALAVAARDGAAPSIVVLGNFTKNDPFEVEPVSKPPPDAKFMEEQELAMLQAKLSSLPPRLQHFLGELQGCMRYENRGLQRTALDYIPVPQLDEEVRSATSEEPYEVVFMQRLLHWFKHKFFRWMNKPSCEHCGSKNTKQLGAVESNDHEKYFGARSTEVVECFDCGGQTRFPRYNDPAKLLETRAGRCGEWANCFTLVVRALGFEARIVHDWTDHVWTEVWSDGKQMWLHADSCEAALDKPLVYEKGWGKKLTYCIAFARDHVRDVTLRYTRKYNDVLQRRNKFPEASLERAVRAVSEYAQSRELRQFSGAATKMWEESRTSRGAKEDADFAEFRTAAPAAEVKPEEEIGRTSGDKAWRESRGELGSSAAAREKALAASDTGGLSTVAEENPKGDLLLQRSHMSDTNSDEGFKLLAESSALPSALRSVTIATEWKDQDFGNRKGRIQACLSRGSEIVAEEDLFGICRDNGASGWKMVTRTLDAQCAVVSESKPGDLLLFRYNVGGGGGHELHIRNFKAGLELDAACATASADSEALDEETRAAIALSLQAEEGAASSASASESKAVPEAPPAQPEDPKAAFQKAVAKLMSEGMSAPEAAAAALKQLAGMAKPAPA